jgi:hypothetical protein
MTDDNHVTRAEDAGTTAEKLATAAEKVGRLAENLVTPVGVLRSLCRRPLSA